MQRFRLNRLKWHQFVLIGIVLVAAFLNLYGLNKEGYGNSYYAAAIKSMLMSWHNFFYNSFDPNGFITIDKPPVDFWIQALFAKIFGFHGWALLLPQALAGVGSVILIYMLVKRTFGVVAGLIASAVMAVTPIAVAVQRTNEVDGMLVFVLLIATWCLWRAIETGKYRFLIWLGVVEGIAFNVKMMEAYLILPAIYLTYFLAAKVSWKKRILQLFALSVILGAVSFSWPLAVDLTPANDRPYVGSTQDNSEMSLIFGYNGISRLTGNRGGSGFGSMSGSGHKGSFKGFGQSGHMTTGDFPSGGWGSFGGHQGSSNNTWTRGQGANASGRNGSGTAGNLGGFGKGGNFGGNGTPGGFGGSSNHRGAFGGGMGGNFNTGTPGVLRLFQSQLGGQIGWLLGFGLLASIPLLRKVRWRKKMTATEHASTFWLAWLLPMVVFFSIAGFFHQYYLITLAPAIAALTGAGVVQMWKDWKEKNSWKWFLPVLFIATLCYEYHMVWSYTSIRVALIATSAVLAVIAAIFFFMSRESLKWRVVTTVLGILSMLILPGYWSMTPILDGVNTSMPAAGPQSSFSSGFGGGGMGGFGLTTSGTSSIDSQLETYLKAHYEATPGSYLVATLDATTAAPLIIDTGLPVMAMGGFSGSDPAMTVQKLEQLTKEGKLKYFLLQGGSGMMGGMGGQSTLTTWIEKNTKLVPTSDWQTSSAAQSAKNSTKSSTTSSHNFGGQGGEQLYEYVGS